MTVDGEEEYEVEAIIRSALRGRGRGRKQHYLVRWKGYGPEYDEWIPGDELEHARDLIDAYEQGEIDKVDVHVVQ